MASLRNQQVAASSLVEITVASAILALVVTLAFTICARLALTGPNVARVRSQQLLASMAAETIRTQAWQTRTVTLDGIELEQEVLPYAPQPYLRELRLTARRQNDTLAQLQQLVYVPSVSTR